MEKQNQEAVASFIASQHAIPTCAKKVGLNLDQLDSPKSERLNLTETVSKYKRLTPISVWISLAWKLSGNSRFFQGHELEALQVKK